MNVQEKKASLVFLFPIFFPTFQGSLALSQSCILCCMGKSMKKNRKSPIHCGSLRQRFPFACESLSRHCQLKFVLKKGEKSLKEKSVKELRKLTHQHSQTPFSHQHKGLAPTQPHSHHQQRMHFYTISREILFSHFHSHFITTQTLGENCIHLFRIVAQKTSSRWRIIFFDGWVFVGWLNETVWKISFYDNLK